MENHRGYTFQFTPGQPVCYITRVQGDDWQKLSTVNLALERGTEYDVMVAARGQSLTSYVGGNLLSQVADDTFSRESILFTLWKRNVARYRNPCIRPCT